MFLDSAYCVHALSCPKDSNTWVKIENIKIGPTPVTGVQKIIRLQITTGHGITKHMSIKVMPVTKSGNVVSHWTHTSPDGTYRTWHCLMTGNLSARHLVVNMIYRTRRLVWLIGAGQQRHYCPNNFHSPAGGHLLKPYLILQYLLLVTQSHYVNKE